MLDNPYVANTQIIESFFRVIISGTDIIMAAMVEYIPIFARGLKLRVPWNIAPTPEYSAFPNGTSARMQNVHQRSVFPKHQLLSIGERRQRASAPSSPNIQVARITTAEMRSMLAPEDCDMSRVALWSMFSRERVETMSETELYRLISPTPNGPTNTAISLVRIREQRIVRTRTPPKMPAALRIERVVACPGRRLRRR